MNIQFSAQHLLEDQSELRDMVSKTLRGAGATDQHLVKMFTSAVINGIITLEKAVKIIKSTHIGEMTGSGAVGGGSTTGGGTTNGAQWDPQGPTGTGEQMATTRASKKRKYQEDAPRLAGNPAKTTSQGAKNLSAYSSVGFTKAPSKEAAAKQIKGVEVKDLWEDELNESRAYSQFKKQTAMRSKDQQMHEAVKVIHKKLEEVSKLVEFAKQMRGELSEGDSMLEYNQNTQKVFEKINSKVIEIYTKTRQLK